MIARKRPHKQIATDVRLILDNIRSVHNTGSIFRTAETLGISHIYCVGTTPVPIDRFGRKRADFAKVSLGAEEMIGWDHVSDDEAARLIRKLKKEGFMVIAVEQAKGSIDYKDVESRYLNSPRRKDGKILVIFGNEVDGVSMGLLKLCDSIAEIPMRGTKESLNVSVAAGVVLYKWFDSL